MDTRRRIMLALAVLLLVGGGAYAASTAVPVQNDIPITTNQTPTVVLGTGAGEDLDLTSYYNGDQLNITTLQGDITVSGDDGARVEISLDDIEGTQTQATGIDAADNWIELDPADKQRVDIRGDANSLSFKSVVVNDGTTDLQITGTTGGSAEVRIHDLTPSKTYALYDLNRGEILATATADGTGTLQSDVALPDGSQTLEVRSADDFDAPTVTNPQPTGQISERPDELSVNATVDATPAEIEWQLDGEVIETTTINSSGTSSVEVPEVDLGEHSWQATITDEVGQTDSVSATFETPDQIELREEHEPADIIEDANVTLRFFSASGDIAVERSVDNGTISMEGLPDSQFVAFAESDEHYTRTIFIDSVYEQETMYLLNETEVSRDSNDAVRSRFVYEDLTGNFPQEDTTIQIQRAVDLNGDGTSEYRTVAGDFWGASSEFEAILERGVRYRLVLINQETGERNVVGSHIPTEELTQNIRVSGLVQSAKNASGVTGLAEYGSGDIVDIAYNDPADQTDQLEITVETQSGGDVIFNETVDGPIGSYERSVQLNESQAGGNYIVQFDAGDRHRSTIPVGDGSVTLPIAVPGWLLSVLMTMAITFAGALYGPRTALLGSWSMVFVSAGVSMFGWAFGAPSVLAAFLIASAFTLLDRVRP